MAGGTLAHDELIVNLIVTLGIYLGRHGPCRVHSSDLKLKAGDHDYYPDACVACGETRARQTRLEDAVLVCEVRSPTTAEFDRGEKFAAYQHLPSLTDIYYSITGGIRRRCSTRLRMGPGPISSSLQALASR